MADKHRWIEPVAVLGVIGWVLAEAIALPVRDVPIGTDWQRYLENAVAIQTGEWADYQRWRGPFHALLCLLVTPLAGHLLEASQAVSVMSVGALIATSAALGRRMMGLGGGVCTALLLAGWPDLALQARMSTPYPLLAGLICGGLWALDLGLRATDGRVRPGPSLLAAVLFGLAGATDARGLVFAGAALLAVAGARGQALFADSPGARGRAPGESASVGQERPHPRACVRALSVGSGATAPFPPGTRTREPALKARTSCRLQFWLRGGPRFGLALVGILGVAALTRGLIVGQLPVEIFPLADQIALQRDLHAREGGLRVCTDHRGAPVAVSELWSACGRTTAMQNLQRVVQVAPFPIWLVAPFALLGVRRRTFALTILPLTLLPAAFLVGLEHRYVLPLAGPVVVLILAGVSRVAELPRIVERSRGFARPVLLAFTLAGFATAWRTGTETLSLRARSGPPTNGRRAPVTQLDPRNPVATTRGWLRANAAPDARILDCAGLSLHLRLYPRAVDEGSRNGRSSSRCQKLIGAAAEPKTLVLSRESVNPSWVKVGEAAMPMSPLQVFRAE